jgi:hypothetical protein
MAGYLTHLLLLLLLVVQVPLIYLGYRPPMALFLVGVAGLFQPLLFVMGQRVLYPDWLKRLRYFPALLLVAIGLAPSNSRAIFEALFGHQHDFVRTPKGQQLLRPGRSIYSITSPNYRLPADWIILAELFLAAYATLGLALCIQKANIGPSFFMATCALGFGYVASASLRELF